jgi:DNA modification methylase
MRFTMHARVLIHGVEWPREPSITVMRPHRPTATSSFGVGRREGHDSSPFYERFCPPPVSSDSTVNRSPAGELLVCRDARHMIELKDNSVALVVTSPPYFAGKDYELSSAEGGTPKTYEEYLTMLAEVFAECTRVLEPGGRIAINVANLGRKPYRSLASDVVTILQDDLGLLLRGEIVWVKAQGAAGNCAWGSFASAANPVLRDLTERIVVACKGRFDRALSRQERKKSGLPYENTITKEQFMEATLDVWNVPPESAKRVGHPAPFPVEIPERLIQLYTYLGDVVLDPFCGSGSTPVAALRTGRRYVGYDTDPDYIELARCRVEAEKRQAMAGGAYPEAMDTGWPGRPPMRDR